MSLSLFDISVLAHVSPAFARLTFFAAIITVSAFILQHYRAVHMIET